MKHTFKEENGKLLADVSFDETEVRTAQDKAVRKLVQNVTVPGFRKGKAPLDKAVRYLRNDDVANGTIDALLRMLDKNFEADETFSSYIKGQKFFNRLHPAVSLEKFDKEAQFKVSYFLRPAVSKLGEYKGLTTEVKEKRILAKDVEAEIKRLANENAELVPSEKEAEMGDTVNIDFVGLMNGEPFDGGSSKGFDLELGSKRFVPGFEEQCVSHKAGDKFDVSLTMPENYPEPLTGKAVVFKVTLNTVKTKEVPEVNDEFATTLSGQYVAENLEDLKAKVKNILGKNAFDTYKRDVVNALLLQVRNSSEFTIADEVIADMLKDREAEDARNLENQGLTLDEYLKLINQTKESYEANLKTGLEDEIKNSLVFDALAKAENVPAPSQKDVEAQIGSPLNTFIDNYTKYLQGQKMSPEQIQNQINGYINQVFSSIMTANVQAKILEINDPELAKREYAPKASKKKPAAKAEEAKAEEVKAEEVKAEEVKAEEPKAEEAAPAAEEKAAE